MICFLSRHLDGNTNLHSNKGQKEVACKTVRPSRRSTIRDIKQESKLVPRYNRSKAPTPIPNPIPQTTAFPIISKHYLLFVHQSQPQHCLLVYP